MESLRSRSANVQMSVSTRPQQTPSKGENAHWQMQESLVHGSPAAEEDDDGLDADDDEAPVVSQEIIVVEDEPEYDAEAAEEADKENNSLPMMPTQSETPMSASPKKKEKRRSSFLGRAWPFSGSSLGFYPEEREPLSPVEPEQALAHCGRGSGISLYCTSDLAWEGMEYIRYMIRYSSITIGNTDESRPHQTQLGSGHVMSWQWQGMGDAEA